MNQSHSIIAPSAKIAADTEIGQFSIVGEDVTIGSGCRIGHHVVIHDGTVLGDDIRVDDHASIGKRPMRAANSAVTKESDIPPASIDSGCIIGSGVILYRGCRIGKQVLIADLATVREDVSIGDFTIIGRGVAIENRCTIGRYVKLETNVYITAYSEIEDRVFVAPCVATSNDNFVGRTEERFKQFKGVIMRKGARVGLNATILPGVELGEDCLIAAGAVVTSDAPAGKILAGIPARLFRDVPDEQLLMNQNWKDK